MHDIKAIRDNPDRYAAAWTSKGLSVSVADILAIDARLRTAQTAAQEAQARKNAAAKEIGALVGQLNRETREDGPDVGHFQALLEAKKLEAGSRGTEAVIQAFEDVAVLEAELRDALAALPNLPAEDVPP